MDKSILYINFSRGWGGLEIFSFNLFNWMSDAGYNILFVVDKRGRLYSKLFENSKYFINVIGLKALKYIDIFTILNLRQIIIKKNIRVIHTFKSCDIWHSVLSAALIAGGKNIKIIHHLQMQPSSARKDIFHKLIYKRLDTIICITKKMRAAVIKLWPVNREIVKVAYHGIDLKAFAAAAGNDRKIIKEKYGFPDNKIIIAIVGQLTEGKGQLIVLKAFAEVMRNNPNIYLAIVGAPPAGEEIYSARLENYINTNNLSDSVKLSGFCDNIPELLSVVDIFILGSREETFGLVILESMAAGCLVIASNAGGVPEIIEDNINGFLYKPFDIDDLTSKIKYVLQLSADGKKQIIKSASQTIADKFSLNKFINEIKKYY